MVSLMSEFIPTLTGKKAVMQNLVKSIPDNIIDLCPVCGQMIFERVLSRIVLSIKKPRGSGPIGDLHEKYL